MRTVLPGIRPGGRPKNSPAIYRWVGGSTSRVSPVGTVERPRSSVVPTGLVYDMGLAISPSDESLGYYQLSLRAFFFFFYIYIYIKKKFWFQLDDGLALR